MVAGAAVRAGVRDLVELENGLRTVCVILPPLHPALSRHPAYLQSVVDAAEELLLRMHAADYGGGGDGSSGGGDAAASGTPSLSSAPPPSPPSMIDTSGYVSEASQLLTGFRSEFLSRFVPAPSPTVPSVASALCERLACRVLLFFVRHASLVRPLGPRGSLQLAKDLSELQMVVSQALAPLEQLPGPYKVLKAFRALLFQVSATVGEGSAAAAGGLAFCGSGALR
eukprot:353643-Chlamydomonas_euryale.AAC.13